MHMPCSLHAHALPLHARCNGHCSIAAMQGSARTIRWRGSSFGLLLLLRCVSEASAATSHAYSPCMHARRRSARRPLPPAKRGVCYSVQAPCTTKSPSQRAPATPTPSPSPRPRLCSAARRSASTRQTPRWAGSGAQQPAWPTAERGARHASPPAAAVVGGVAAAVVMAAAAVALLLHRRRCLLRHAKDVPASDGIVCFLALAGSTLASPFHHTHGTSASAHVSLGAVSFRSISVVHTTECAPVAAVCMLLMHAAHT